MFTQELPAWRKKQRRQTASFQGKYRVEKSGGNLAHIRGNTPPTHRPRHALTPSSSSAIIEVPTLTERQRPGNGQQSKPGGAAWGGQWGGAWRTPGRTVGSCPRIPENALPKRHPVQRGSHRSAPLTQINHAQGHTRPTSRAHLCGYRGTGGRMCMMVAQHS